MEQQALSEALRDAAQEADAVVEAGLEDAVVRAGDTAIHESLPRLGIEVTRLAAALAAASVQLEPLPPLTADLSRCRAVIAEIDALLQAMTG
jgi:type II secretory pathway component PulM